MSKTVSAAIEAEAWTFDAMAIGRGQGLDLRRHGRRFQCQRHYDYIDNIANTAVLKALLHFVRKYGNLSLKLLHSS